MLLFSRLDRNTRESAQCLERSAVHLWKSDVHLNDFIAIPLARVLYVDLDVQRIASLQLRARKFQPTVFEVGVAQSVAEGIERLSREVAIRAVLHGVIFKLR